MKIIFLSLTALLFLSAASAAEKHSCVDLFGNKSTPEGHHESKVATTCLNSDVKDVLRSCKTVSDCVLIKGHCKSVGVNKDHRDECTKFYEPCLTTKCEKTTVATAVDCIKGFCQAK